MNDSLVGLNKKELNTLLTSMGVSGGKTIEYENKSIVELDICKRGNIN